MPVAIITTNRTERLRALSSKHPYMSTLDTAKLTGEPHRLVKRALGREIAGMPLSSAKLMVR
jgi:hypothetical protein